MPLKRAQAVLTAATPEHASHLKDTEASKFSAVPSDAFAQLNTNTRARALLSRLEEAEKQGEKQYENARKKQYEEMPSSPLADVSHAAVQVGAHMEHKSVQTVAEVGTQTHCDASTSMDDVLSSHETPCVYVPTEPMEPARTAAAANEAPQSAECAHCGSVFYHQMPSAERDESPVAAATSSHRKHAQCKVFKPHRSKSKQKQAHRTSEDPSEQTKRAPHAVRTEAPVGSHSRQLATSTPKTEEHAEVGGTNDSDDVDNVSLTAELGEELRLEEVEEDTPDEEVPASVTDGTHDELGKEPMHDEDIMGDDIDEDAPSQSVGSLAQLEREIEEQHRHLLQDGVISPDELSSNYSSTR